MKKKKLSVLLALLLVFSIAVQASAAGSPVNKTPVDDAEYEAKIAEILASYAEDPEVAIQALAELDTELVSAPTTVEHGNASCTRATYPSDYELTVSCTKRTNSSRLYLQWILKANATELFAGPLDYVGLEWDTEYADYYLSTTGGTGCTLQGRNTGIVLFNVEDVKLSAGDYVFGTVQVTPRITGWMEFGSKFVHTYTTANISGRATASFAPSTSSAAAGGSLALPHTMTFTVNVSSGTSQWQLWADNAVKIQET